MRRATANIIAADRPVWAAYVELLKPITWFPPMWAFGCGIISSGVALTDRWPWAVAGVLLAGPMVCGTSQIVNDWFDRHVDAINEPGRPIPSGRVPGNTALYYAILWTFASTVLAAFLGISILIAAVIGLALAWAYSAPPFRFKQNGWLGNGAVGICYEGLPWFTAAAVMLGTQPGLPVVLLALLYSIGAHGIMTLNDFKAIEGDKVMGVRSLPVMYGAQGAARLTCLVMALPQVGVIVYLNSISADWAAATVGALLLAQALLMVRFLKDPVRHAVWFSGFGVALYVLGMLASAFAIRPAVAI